MSSIDSIYINPTKASSDHKLTDEQVHSWREFGFCLVDDLLDTHLIDQVTIAAHNFYSIESTSGLKADFGASDNQEMIFPSLEEKNSVINQIPLNESIIDAVCQLLNCEPTEIRLTQCELWSKLGKDSIDVTDEANNDDQRLHVDAYNHYLTVPSSWYSPELVSMIIYYDNSSDVGGETAVIPREGSKDPAYHELSPEDSWPLLLTPGGRGDLPWINNRYLAEDFLKGSNPDVYAFRESLYAREKKAKYNKGSILFYRHDIWHRGTPVNAGKIRRTHNLAYKRNHCDWINNWNSGAAKRMYERSQVVEKIIAKSNMKQRVVLGFPSADSPYWTPFTWEAVKRRYSPISGGFQHIDEIENAVRSKFPNYFSSD